MCSTKIIPEHEKTIYRKRIEYNLFFTCSSTFIIVIFIQDIFWNSILYQLNSI